MKNMQITDYVPDDDIIAAQKAINEAAKSVDPALSSAAVPPEPEPMPIAPAPSEEPKESEPVVTAPPIPPIHEAGEKLMSDLLEPAPVPTIPATDTDSLTVKPEHPRPPSGGMKKKSITGGIIAIVAVLLFTLPVAVYFLSRQNQQIADVRSRATGTSYPGCRTGPGFECCTEDPNACAGQGGPNACHCQGGQDCTGTKCENIESNCRNDGREWCTNSQGYGMTCCARGYVCNPGGDGCVPGGGGPTNTPRPGDDDDDNDDTTNPSATPTTGTAPVCQNIKIYKNGTHVTNPSTLRSGDDVVLAVKGNMSPTKAHFRINGGSWTETTAKNSSNEFTLNYTIPEGVDDFVIEGEVFTNGAWR